MQSLVHPIARRSFLATGASGQTPNPLRTDDGAMTALAERLPASSSADYGTPFYEIFKRYDNQFYKIDRGLFSPAEVTLNNLATGRVARAGRLAPDVLRASLGLG